MFLTHWDASTWDARIVAGTAIKLWRMDVEQSHVTGYGMPLPVSVSLQWGIYPYSGKCYMVFQVLLGWGLGVFECRTAGL